MAFGLNGNGKSFIIHTGMANVGFRTVIGMDSALSAVEWVDLCIE